MLTLSGAVVIMTCITSGDILSTTWCYEVSVVVVVIDIVVVVYMYRYSTNCCTCIGTQLAVSVLSPPTAGMYSNQLLTK